MDTTQQFRILADTWEEETILLSSSQKAAQHPAHQAIIEMGSPVVTHILQRMKERGGHWFEALSAITGANPIPTTHHGNIAAMQQDWLKWGAANGYIPQESTPLTPDNFRSPNQTPLPGDPMPAEHHLSDIITQDLFPKVLRSLGAPNLLEFTRRNSLPVLTLLPSSNQSPLLSLRLRKDGTIATHPRHLDEPLLLTEAQAKNKLARPLQAAITRAILKDRRAKHLFIRTLTHHTYPDPYTTIIETAQTFLGQYVTTAVTPSGPRTARPEASAGLWNRLVRKHFLDTSVMKRLVAYKLTYVTIAQYNTALRNTALQDTHQDNPTFAHLFHYFLRYHAPEAPNRPFQSMDDLTDFIAQQLDIPEHNRRLIHRAVGTHYVHWAPQIIGAACRAISEAGLTEDIPDISHLARRSEHLSFLKAGPPIWGSWIEALTQYRDDQDYRALIDRKVHLEDLLTHDLHLPKHLQPSLPNSTPHLDQLLLHIDSAAKTYVKSHTPRWTPLRVTKKGSTTTLKVIVQPNGHARTTIIRRPDNTISQHPVEPDSDLTPLRFTEKLTAPLLKRLASQLMLHTLNHHPKHFQASAQLDPTLPTVTEKCMRVAKKIAQETALSNSKTCFADLPQTVNKAITKHIADPDALHLASNIFQEVHTHTHQAPTLPQYNLTKTTSPRQTWRSSNA